jgi:hypothetical protein
MTKPDTAAVHYAITAAEDHARKLEDIHSAESERYDSRSEAYQDSDKGQEAYSRLESLREAFEYLDQAADALRAAIE